MEIAQLSKTDYIKGLQCSKSLWFFKNRKDLKLPIDKKLESKFESGNEINELARKYFSNGVKADDNYFDIKKAVLSTQELISRNHNIIFEATAQGNNFSHTRIDILQKSKNEDGWDLIEVKGSTSAKPSHLNDLSFQLSVFTEAGYKINSCILMLLNKEYIFNNNLDIEKLFKFEDVTSDVFELQSSTKLIKGNLKKILEEKSEPAVKIGAHCFEKKDHHYECDFKYHCFQNIPQYSAFDIYQKKKAEQISEEIDSYEISDIPSKLLPKGLKKVDVDCYLNEKTHFDKAKLNEFLSNLEYPLYFLDYETFQLPVPIFNISRPYQQIPFQFSLHIQYKPNSELKHFEFLHQNNSDPREDFIQNLIKTCDNKGSIIVYHQSFEETRNKELARDFPQYSSQILSLNSRLVDLEIPFKNKYIYSPKQQSSSSIKKVLPAFTDLNYQDLEIKSGGDAMNIYANFIKGETLLEGKLIKDLLEYCKRDTYAMVMLLNQLLELNE